MGPLSLDNFRKNMSASWRVVGLETSDVAYEVWRTDVLCAEISIPVFKRNINKRHYCFITFKS